VYAHTLTPVEALIVATVMVECRPLGDRCGARAAEEEQSLLYTHKRHTHTYIYILLNSSAYKSLVCERREGAGRACVCVLARPSLGRQWRRMEVFVGRRCTDAVSLGINPIEFLPIYTHTQTYTYI